MKNCSGQENRPRVLHKNQKEHHVYGALHTLGKALHCLQDIDAHGNYGINSPVAVQGTYADNINYDWKNSNKNSLVKSTKKIRYNNTKSNSYKMLKKFIANTDGSHKCGFD